jgi:hypothetical protein
MIVKLKTVADYEDVKLIWAQVIVEEWYTSGAQSF